MLMTVSALLSKMLAPTVVSYIESRWFASDKGFDQIRPPTHSLLVEVLNPAPGETQFDGAPEELVIGEVVQTHVRRVARHHHSWWRRHVESE